MTRIRCVVVEIVQKFVTDWRYLYGIGNRDKIDERSR